MCEVLYIEDDLTFSELASKRITGAVAEINGSPGGRCPQLHFTLVTSLHEAEAFLLSGKFDAIVLDLTLGENQHHTTPIETLQIANLRARDWPAYIVATGDKTGQYEKTAMECGAQAFWVKDDLLRYPLGAARAIVQAIWRKADAVKRYA